ncbi:hypothetical protein WN943_023696 [Citrus x changshan-huyou]
MKKHGNMLIDFPMKFLMPSSFENIKEIAFKTMPSASKIEIKQVPESLYGPQIEKVASPVYPEYNCWGVRLK